jgi:acetyl-CoA carboxylase biotin carboxyl carrier protein
MNFEVDYIKKLAKVLYENDLTEIQLETKDDENNDVSSIVLKREHKNQANVIQVPNVITQAIPVQQENNRVEEKPLVVEAEEKVTGTPIVSPMVGTFYSSASPDDEPFVKVGDVVSQGQVVCIIEAMKLMNKIESEISGKITKICVENATAVEYGQVLMYVE